MQDGRIRAILFDVGGVIVAGFEGADHNAIEAEFGLEPNTLRRCYAESRYKDNEEVKCTFDDWIESTRAALERHAGAKAGALMQAWRESARTPNHDMADLIKRLHGRYKLGIISNHTTMQRLRERIDFVDVFDIVIGSGDLGVAKPDPSVFLHAAESLGVPPETCVFTDDYAKHVQGARAIGMHGFHFTGYPRFVEDLHSVGVTV